MESKLYKVGHNGKINVRYSTSIDRLKFISKGLHFISQQHNWQADTIFVLSIHLSLVNIVSICYKLGALQQSFPH